MRRADFISFKPLLALILLASALFSLLSFNYSFPYVEYVDEPTYYFGARQWRGLDPVTDYFANVPPGFLGVHVAVQTGLEAVGIRGLTETTGALRLLSAALNLITLTCIAYTARRAAGDVAGLIAAAAWLTAPIVSQNYFNALPDPYLYMLTALALWSASVALTDPSRRHWSIYSCLAGLVAVVFKYPIVPVLLPAFVVGVYTLRERQGRYLLAIQIALIAAVAFLLIVVYGVDFNNLQREGQVVARSGFRNLFNASRVANNIYRAGVPIGEVLPWGVLVLGVVAWFVNGRRRDFALAGIVVLSVAILLSIPWVVAMYDDVQGKYRYVLPATTAFCVLLGIAVSQVNALVVRRGVPSFITVGLFAAVMFVPNIINSAALLHNYRLPDQRVPLREWAEFNLPVGKVLVEEVNHKTFNSAWSGLDWPTWFNWEEIEDITEFTPEAWRFEAGASYAALTTAAIEKLESTAAGQAYLDELLRLHAVIMGDAGRGPDTVIYRLWRMDVETRVAFGTIELVGYDTFPTEVASGETVNLQLYWQAATPPENYYSLFVHLQSLEPDEEPLAQLDGPPAGDTYHTVAWTQPEEIIVGRPLALTVPANLPAGAYRLVIGLYDPQTGVRLPTEGGDSYLLATLNVAD